MLHLQIAFVPGRMEFARAHMETKGWNSGEGLGRHGQGITDAIKPKLKFDQAGVGHNKAEEFEFQWWDHVFNKAAKTVTVEEGRDGQVKVDFNSGKSELSTKKLRRKAEKAMRKEVKTKLYSNFVKSGTLTGGVLEEEQEDQSGFVEDKDLSKLRTLTDAELVKACGGRTAHKGGRHGHRMEAKLARIERAEAEYMENYRREQEAAEAVKIKKMNKRTADEAALVPEIAPAEEPVKKKKKSRKSAKESVESPSIAVENLENLEPVVELEVRSKKKKSKKSKAEPLEEEPPAPTIAEKPRKKKKKSKGGSD